MASVSQNGSNGKLILTTVVVTDPAEFDSILNLPDVSASLHDRVQSGQVETGSEWDGVPLDEIYEIRLKAGDHPDTAASVVDSIMLNRYYFERQRRERERIEATLEALEFDPPLSLWEVE